MQRQTPVGLRGERIEFALGEKRAGKVAGRRAKKLRKPVQVGNGGIQLPTKRQLRPTAAFLWPEQLAIDGQLVLALPHVKLIDLEAAIVVGRTEHHIIGPPRAPDEVGQFHPDRSGRIEELARISAEGEFRRTHCARDRLQETHRARNLGERNVGGRARDIDVKFLARPSLETGAQRPAIGIEMKIDPERRRSSRERSSVSASRSSPRTSGMPAIVRRAPSHEVAPRRLANVCRKSGEAIEIWRARNLPDSIALALSTTSRKPTAVVAVVTSRSPCAMRKSSGQQPRQSRQSSFFTAAALGAARMLPLK